MKVTRWKQSIKRSSKPSKELEINPVILSCGRMVGQPSVFKQTIRTMYDKDGEYEVMHVIFNREELEKLQQRIQECLDNPVFKD